MEIQKHGRVSSKEGYDFLKDERTTIGIAVCFRYEGDALAVNVMVEDDMDTVELAGCLMGLLNTLHQRKAAREILEAITSDQTILS